MHRDIDFILTRIYIVYVLELTDENEAMRKYIDTMMVQLMDKYPHVLEHIYATM